MKARALVNDMPYITKGKIYNVLSEGGFYTYVKVDNDDIVGFEGTGFKERFEKVRDTMNGEKIKSEIDELKDKIKQLEGELHKKIEKGNKKKWWTPSRREDYWYVGADGFISTFTYEIRKGDSIVLKNLVKLDNCFQTKGQAERELFEKQLRFKLKKFAYENNEKEIDWNNREQSKYSIYYNYEDKELDWECNTIGRDFNQIHFTSQDIVKKAIELFKDDLIRYFTSDK